MCGSMADIQSATAEIREEKKKKKKKETTGQKYNGLPYSIYGGHNKSFSVFSSVWLQHECTCIEVCMQLVT